MVTQLHNFRAKRTKRRCLPWRIWPDSPRTDTRLLDDPAQPAVCNDARGSARHAPSCKYDGHARVDRTLVHAFSQRWTLCALAQWSRDGCRDKPFDDTASWRISSTRRISERRGLRKADRAPGQTRSSFHRRNSGVGTPYRSSDRRSCSPCASAHETRCAVSTDRRTRDVSCRRSSQTRRAPRASTHATRLLARTPTRTRSATHLASSSRRTFRDLARRVLLVRTFARNSIASAASIGLPTRASRPIATAKRGSAKQRHETSRSVYAPCAGRSSSCAEQAWFAADRQRVGRQASVSQARRRATPGQTCCCTKHASRSQRCTIRRGQRSVSLARRVSVERRCVFTNGVTCVGVWEPCPISANVSPLSASLMKDAGSQLESTVRPGTTPRVKTRGYTRRSPPFGGLRMGFQICCRPSRSVVLPSA